MGDTALQARWKALRDSAVTATPDQLRQLLDEIGDTDPDRRNLLAAYEHYRSRHTHLDVELWKARDKIPRLKKTIAPDKTEE